MARPVTCSETTDYPGLTWHGVNSAITNQVNSPPEIYFSPRVGLSWDVFGHGKTYRARWMGNLSP